MNENNILTIYLFGGTGDLSRKKLIPALFYLFAKKLLPSFRLVAIARQDLTLLQYAQLLTDSITEAHMEEWPDFLKHIEYVSGDSGSDDLYERLERESTSKKIVGDRIFYLATLPHLYATIAKQLRFHHLTENSQGWCRLLVEKPFGVDLETSRALNKELLSVFPEKDIFRIDHFLAKETVQNILAFRFANGVFENLWNSQYVDHIQVTSAEPMGVEGRERFYNDVGVVRDVVQNHVLSLLAIALMEEPATFDPKSIQKERLRLLSQIEVLSETAVGERVKFGQYSQSDQESLLERSVPTAVALRLSVLSRRWHGVPIYIRAGKKLPCRVTELSVVFKEPLNRMFDKTNTKQPPNILTFRIQPNEGIILCINVKKPGFEYGIERVPMSFCYSSSFTDSQLPEAYSKVIYDAIKGDATLFLDEQGVDASWEAVQSMLVDSEEVPAEYEAASWGPESFSTLIQKDGREWIEPDLSSCSLR